MKFLCLAHGDEDGWNSLTEGEKLIIVGAAILIGLAAAYFFLRGR